MIYDALHGLDPDSLTDALAGAALEVRVPPGASLSEDWHAAIARLAPAYVREVDTPEGHTYLVPPRSGPACRMRVVVVADAGAEDADRDACDPLKVSQPNTPGKEQR